MNDFFYIHFRVLNLFFIFVRIIDSQQLCPHPDVPLYGNYTPKLNKFPPGDIVTYKCLEGYTLMGKDTSKCKSNGDWSNPTPFCDLKVQVKSPLTITRQGHALPSPQITDENTSTCSAFNNDESLTMSLDKTGSVYAVRLYLKRGNVHFEIKSGAIICTVYKKYVDTNQWVCLQCDRNVPLSNFIKFQGKSDKTNNNTICEIEIYVKEEEGCDRPPDRRVANGYLEVTRSLAKLICEDGYETDGASDRLVCEKNVWVGSRLQCNEILCKPSVTNPAIPGSEWAFVDPVRKISAGTRRKLKCNEGYRKTGDPDTVICQKDGVWTTTNATCTKGTETASTNTIVICVAAIIAVLVIIALFATIIHFVRKQRREIVVVYKTPTDGSMASGSEAEYASIYYESIKSTISQPQPPTTSRPTVQMISDGYILPLDSHESLKKQPTPVDIAFGTLKESSLY